MFIWIYIMYLNSKTTLSLDVWEILSILSHNSWKNIMNTTYWIAQLQSKKFLIHALWNPLTSGLLGKIPIDYTYVIHSFILKGCISQPMKLWHSSCPCDITILQCQHVWHHNGYIGVPIVARKQLRWCLQVLIISMTLKLIIRNLWKQN